MKVAAVQLNSTADKAANMAAADRLTRAAAADGAQLIVLPEKWTVLGRDEDLRAGAESLDGPAIAWARELARELRVDLVAGSLVERRAGSELLANTSVHVGPDGEVRAAYRKLHMFDVEVEGRAYRESAVTEPGEEVVLSATAEGVELGMAICYDLRFPELFGALAARGARVVVLPSAFTLPTTRDHWEILVRARAIENEVFVIAANQVGEHPGGQPLRRALADRRPLGHRARTRAGRRGLHRGRPRPRPPAGDPRAAARARAPPRRRLRAIRRARRRRATRMSASRPPAARAKNGPDKRRMILDAAVRVFANQGFHACRVSDIADEAGVAYGLVYHYFASKDEILDTLFLERWEVMLQTIRQVDAQETLPRAKLHAIASFIVDSYSHDPDLMKVIIVEVTRAANSFGQTHLAQIREAYDLIAQIVTAAQAEGAFKAEIDAEFAALAFYGAIEQMLTGWIFGLLPRGEEHYERAKWLVVETVCGGLETTTVGNTLPG